MERWKVSIAVVLAALALLLYTVPSVVLIIFSGMLMAAFFNGGGSLVARPTGIPKPIAIAVFALIVILAIALTITFAATSIASQFNELISQLPSAVETLRERLAQHQWANRLIESINPENFLGRGTDVASSAVTSTFGALGNFVIILFIGIYLALDPKPYRRGIVKLVAPSLRTRFENVLLKSAKTLKNWLSAQLIAMTVVGFLTGFGLFLIGMPLSIILGVIAGMLAFIPNIGPVLAIAPALLLALSENPTMVLWVLAVYLSVQALESYFITPLIQQERVDLPAALVIGSQLFFGVLFGLLGLALAMPLTAVVRTMVRELYVHDYLDREPAAIETTNR